KTSVVESLLSTGRSGNVILMSDQTKLNFLGDIFWLPAWVPGASAFSIGDAILALGIIWLLQGKLHHGKHGTDRESTEDAQSRFP
ncbi:MAG: DUF5317 family protein, partial [Candidatus Bipolaricaulota bacterium]|nr:DUF5317 family protein [Candidatus Bipolaricaulota bacterium]